ncbi:MAG TPA: glycosyltransferase family 2 protein [Clostridiaceae bacterium]|nr:glycosyltransferase family 2 protein [Clostridiaceae bacterium]
MKKVTIIVPAYNEEESLPFLRKRLNEFMNNIQTYEFEILFVNDGSQDKTLELVKKWREEDKRISYVDFSRNFGKETAMIAGLDYATGDCVIFMDADLQDPPELIPELLKWWEVGYDDVYARRKSRKGETWLKKFTSKMYYKVLQSLTNVEIQKDTGDFRLLDRRCVNALKMMRESQRCSKSMFSWIGYKKKEVLYDRDPRVAGKTKWNYKKLVDLAIDGITSFTTSPLRLSTYICIPTFFALFIYFIYVIIKSFVVNEPIQAFQATILLILFFSGIQIMLFGIIGEYLGRIFNESKNRPLYLVNEYNDKRENNELEDKEIIKNGGTNEK